MDDGKNKQQPVFPISLDLVYDRSIRDSLSEVAELSGEVVFSPFNFKKADLSGDLKEHRMSKEQLLGLGEVATQAKARF